MKNVQIPTQTFFYGLVACIALSSIGCSPLQQFGSGIRESYDSVGEYLDDIEITYPDRARESSAEGWVIVEYTIMPDGSLSDITLVRDIGDGCGVAVVNALYVFNHVTRLSNKASKNRREQCRVIFKLTLAYSNPCVDRTT
ncbi:MAG: hypothetical protein GC192_21295 [Bacteroidetes bacterium]|nr:hypothetical protein [Bacteroidota bacterium]